MTHDADLDAQHGWGQCDHLCCATCAQATGEPIPDAATVETCKSLHR